MTDKIKKSKKTKVFFIFLFLNIAVTIYMFFGTFTVRGSWVVPLTDILKQKTGVDLKFNKFIFNMTKCNFYNLELSNSKKDIFLADEIFVSYDLKAAFKGEYINLNVKGKKIVFLNERKIFLNTNNIKANELALKFKGSQSGGLKGMCDVDLKGLASTGEYSLFKDLRKMLDVKSIKEFFIEKTIITFDINSYKLIFKNIELENKDFYLYGKGSYLLGKDMDFKFDIKYLPESLFKQNNLALIKKDMWNTMSFNLYGYIHAPKIQIKNAKLNVKEDFI